MIDQSRERFPDVLSDDFVANAAIQVIIFYLGLDWCEKAIFDQKRLKDANHWFLNNGRQEHNSIRFSRIVLLADTLFRLKEVVGFDILVKRFHTRISDPKSCFLEAYAASEFIDNNTTIQIRKQVNVKGQDFDFKIIHGGCAINVEVTSKDLGNIKEKSFLNILKKKHEQLPANAPSIIFVYISQTQNLSVEIQGYIKMAVAEFFRRNSRVNYIIVFSDIIIKSKGEQSVSVVGSIDFSNPNPRFKVPVSTWDRAPFGKVNTGKIKSLDGSASIGAIISNLLPVNAKFITTERSFLSWYHQASSTTSPTSILEAILQFGQNAR